MAARVRADAVWIEVGTARGAFPMAARVRADAVFKRAAADLALGGASRILADTVCVPLLLAKWTLGGAFLVRAYKLPAVKNQ